MKTNMRFGLVATTVSVGCAVCSPLAFGEAAASASVVQVAVRPAEVLAEVSPNIYGLGMEDVNHEIYGGLDAQRLYGESFEEPAPPPGKGPLDVRESVSGCWSPTVRHPGELIHDRTKAHWGEASQLLVPNGCTSGILNAGLGKKGISAVRGRSLRGHVWACGSVGALRVFINGPKGRLASADLDPAPGRDWRRLEFVLTPEATEPAATFEILAYGYGRIWIDDAYLADAPTNAFGRIGCREDVVAGLKSAGVNFIRWGGTMCNAEDYLLKNFDGTRKPYRGFWHQYSSGGFGPREFVRLAATLNVPCAVSIAAREDVAEAVKFAREIAAYDTPICVEIGNEECIVSEPAGYRQYCALSRALVSAMRAANPKLTFASAAWWNGDMKLMEEVFRATDGLFEFWDLHPFFTTLDECLKNRNVVHDFLKTIRTWNPKTTMRAAVFEENGSRQDISRALCHALMLEEIRKAGRDVLTSCPANAFQVWGMNDNGWDQGNVFMTPDKVWLSPCGWAQQMASGGHRELLVGSTSGDSSVHVSAVSDRKRTSLVLHVVNVADASREAVVSVPAGTTLELVRMTELSAPALNTVNTPEAPRTVVPRQVGGVRENRLPLKPHSYAVAEFLLK